MQRTATQEETFEPLPPALELGCRVGSIVGVTEFGQPVVDFPGNAGAPIAARSIVAVDQEERPDFLKLSVLLIFENGDVSLPIVVGVVQHRISPPSGTLMTLVKRVRPGIAQIDGRKVVLEAKNEIILRCGKGSITLRRDGKIVVKGTDLVSRALRNNKIKGSSVAIN